nr:hypothetical protein GCM10020092_004420 [Actinoplanes digitatis]
MFPADLARHFAAAVPLAGAGPALSWARAAADADRAGYAFTDAAGQLARARAAVTDAGDRLTAAELVLLLTEEADLRLRGGDAGTARELLDTAWARATPTGDAALLGAVALGLDRIGARFAMPRTDLIAVLETARSALVGGGTAAEAQVTAAIARQLQHSVSVDRRQAGPLAERAVAIARGLDDPATLANCLLAQHDTLWTVGTAGPRQAIATEIAELARRTGDSERHAQALLLTATAELESGSAAFRATLSQYRYITERLRQPRQTYNLRIREAALALLDGDIDLGERLADEAAALGEAVGDGDTGNVRMSQRLEITRFRADPDELRATAAAAVDWWIGAPAHAHAVAVGFFARVGDLAAARREVDTVLALEDWRTDRSYLWSVFVGELATAAIALADRPLCARLLDDLLPHAETCAVNAALVCFMGAHAHRVGLLYAALGDRPEAGRWLRRALEVHRQLGAQAWEAETRAALAGLPLTDAPVMLRRSGDLWTAGFRGAHRLPARRQGPARPGDPARPARGGRARAGAGQPGVPGGIERSGPGARPAGAAGVPAAAGRPRRGAGHRAGPQRRGTPAAGNRRTRTAARGAAPGHPARRGRPVAGAERRRARPQGRHGTAARRHPPHRRGPPRPRRVPGPHRPHGIHLPVRPAGRLICPTGCTPAPRTP